GKRVNEIATGSRAGEASTEDGANKSRSPYRHRFSQRGISTYTQGRCIRGGWTDGGGLRQRPGRQSPEFTEPIQIGDVQSATGQTNVHTERRWYGSSAGARYT